ncbi:hypothetical protein [Lutimonas sp.]|uniref:hypothetical protein n=1 Tax=Lutimonas sp. TaxID=1872403 RepID=UPI003D9ACDC9
MVTIDLESFEKKTITLQFENESEKALIPLSYYPLRFENFVYFVQGQGGMVFTIQNDTIKRIDNSYDHGMQYGASIFKHNNTVFKYGGYGFWSVRDFFTYYDKMQHEWEVYHPIESATIPKGLHGSFWIKDASRFYVFNGQYINENNRRQNFKNTELWSFDFSTNTWNLFGRHDFIDMTHKTVAFKNKLLLITRNNLIQIDIKNNLKTTYSHSPLTAQLNSMRHVTFFKGKFYMVLINKTGSYLTITDEESFFGTIEKEEKFYKNTSYWFTRILLYTVVLSFIILMFLISKQRLIKMNKLQLLDNGIKYKNKFSEIEPESMAILKLLLKNKEVPSSEILKIVEKQQYSPAHNERIKVQKINDINIKIATLLGTKENVITNVKSSADRRIRLYNLSKKYFNLKTVK